MAMKNKCECGAVFEDNQALYFRNAHGESSMHCPDCRSQDIDEKNICDSCDYEVADEGYDDCLECRCATDEVSMSSVLTDISMTTQVLVQRDPWPELQWLIEAELQGMCHGN